MPTTVPWPNTTGFTFSKFDAQLRPSIRMSESIFTGRVQTFETPFPKWSFTGTIDVQSITARAAVEALLNKIRGSANRVTMWHHARPVPRGTLQANTTTNATRVRGDSTLSFAATTGFTMLAGDMLSVVLSAPAVGSALLMVLDDAIASAGSMTVNIPPLRGAVANGATVTVVRPTAVCVLTEAPRVPYAGAVGGELTLQFEETYA